MGREKDEVGVIEREEEASVLSQDNPDWETGKTRYNKALFVHWQLGQMYGSVAAEYIDWVGLSQRAQVLLFLSFKLKKKS